MTTGTIPEGLPFDAAPGGKFPQIMPAPYRIIFDPAAPAQLGNIYTTWAAAYTVARKFQGPKVIVVRGTIPTAVGQPGNFWDPLGAWSLEIDCGPTPFSIIGIDEGATFNPANPPIEIYSARSTGGTLQSNATATIPFQNSNPNLQTKVTGLSIGTTGSVSMFSYAGDIVLNDTSVSGNTINANAVLVSATKISFFGGSAPAPSISGTSTNILSVDAPVIVAGDLTNIATDSIVHSGEVNVYAALSATVSGTQVGVGLLTIQTLLGPSLVFPTGNNILISQVTAAGPGHSLSIIGQSSTNNNGGSLMLQAGNGSGPGHVGGSVIINAGVGTVLGSYGTIQLQLAGTALATFEVVGTSAIEVFGSSFTSGVTLTQTGVAAGNGAQFLIQAQGTTAIAGVGGIAALSGGISTGPGGVGGNALVQGGPGDPGSGIGGSVVLNAGNGGFAPGSIIFSSASTNWLTVSLAGSLGKIEFAPTVAGLIDILQGSSGTGTSLTVAAQSMTAASAIGGALILSGGGSGGNNGVGGAIQVLGGSAGGGSSTGGAVLIQPGSGSFVNGDVHINFGSGASALRVISASNSIGLSAPLLGDITTSDPLRFGVSAPISLSGAVDVTLTPTQYRNFTLRFSGTPAAPFNINFPNQAGYTKLLDFSQVNMSSLSTSLTIKIGAVTAVLPNTFRSTGSGPVVLMSWDGTTIDLTPAITQTETAYASGGVIALNSVTYTSVLSSVATIKVDRSANLDIWVSANLGYTGTPLSTAARFTMKILIDGSPLVANDFVSVSVSTATEIYNQYARNVRTILAPGTHTIDLQVLGPNVTSTSSFLATLTADASFT
jgi:hypothetical protein